MDTTTDPELASGFVEKEQGDLDKSSNRLVALIMLALSLAVFCSALDTTIVTTALPKIAEHFHSAAGFTWIGASYILASAASTPLWGKISDIFGRKPILLVANIVFMIGSLIAALSINVGMLITARTIQGIGGGGLLTLVDIVICDLFSLRTRGAYLGIIGATWAVACGIGPVIGGVFTQKVSWRWCFYINLPLDGLAIAIIVFFLKLKTPRTPIWEGLRAIDWLGTFLVTGGTVLLVFGLQYGGITFPWESATVICLIIFGALQFALFLLVEWKASAYPVMPLRLFRNRSNCGVLMATFFHGLSFIGPLYYLPLYFQAVRGASPLLSGVYLLPIVIAVGFSAIGTGAFIGITGKYLPPIYFGWVFNILGLGLFIDFDAHSGWAKLIIYQAIAGLGIGPNFQAPLVALQTLVDVSDIATSTATFNFLRTIAIAIGLVLGQVVYSNQLQKKQRELVAELGPATARLLSGGDAAANTAIIQQLPDQQRAIARAAYADALMPMFIMYACFAAAGLLASLLVKKSKLSREHTVQETGLEAEKEYQRKRNLGEEGEEAAAAAAKEGSLN